MLISALWGADMSIGECRYRHPTVPILGTFMQVKGLRGVRPLHTTKRASHACPRTGCPAVLAQALRSSGCQLSSLLISRPSRADAWKHQAGVADHRGG